MLSTKRGDFEQTSSHESIIKLDLKQHNTKPGVCDLNTIIRVVPSNFEQAYGKKIRYNVEYYERND